jgi:hypothetical protein
MQMNQKLSNLPVCYYQIQINRHSYIDFISAILGFTGLINQVQYHAALTDKGLPSSVGGWNGKNQTNKKNRMFNLLFS